MVKTLEEQHKDLQESWYGLLDTIVGLARTLGYTEEQCSRIAETVACSGGTGAFLLKDVERLMGVPRS